ncbi:MAG: alpha/beta fold hydrolase [Candidatus Hermodarchaeota archaeon]
MQGWGSSHDEGFYQIEYFKNKSMVITFDTRGTGKSSRPDYPYTMDMFLDDIKNLLEYLKINQKIHLYGHSFGGAIIQNFVLKYPDMVRTLILDSTSAKTNSKQLFDAYSSMENMNPDQKCAVYFPTLFSRDYRKELKNNKELYKKLKDIYMENPTTNKDYLNLIPMADEHDTRKLLHTITHPTLIIAGNKDRIVPFQNSEYIHSELPNSTLKILEGLGHGACIEAADEVNDIIWNFIQKH